MLNRHRQAFNSGDSNPQFERDAPAGLSNPATEATDLAIRREHVCQNENCCSGGVRVKVLRGIGLANGIRVYSNTKPTCVGWGQSSQADFVSLLLRFQSPDAKQ